ncbi:YraN family protein [Palleronia sp. LCG004]|uniref:YraN family protein n=1 Tax=Palleronia sp. LCG004 TaxID=3079304 RepID=UPI002942394F|nr:YraN family protein [Palleronia sp. LCG004]WOI56940.1 YraN family protein [Palleronia sp. LCG004]
MDPLKNHLSGGAAEEQVARWYADAGHEVLARRWRGRSGEIDLVCRVGSAIVFVEVKRAATHARAAERIGPRQIARILSAASEYLEGMPDGQRTETRFDAALVDGAGQIEIREAAFP